MRRVTFGNRRAAQIENGLQRVSVMEEGGHVAEILHKQTGVNPLWIPPWPSIEPSTYDANRHPEYGGHAEAQLLSGITGHNLCLDLFGAPTKEEAAAGIPVHGEAPVSSYEISGESGWMMARTRLPKAQLRFTRRISVGEGSSVIRFSETLENESATDRPVGWTQHVTVGPPFLELGQTEFRVSATRSQVMDASFNDGKGPQKPDAQFDWPFCPLKDGRTSDLRVFTAEPVSAGFTAHLMDPRSEHSFFMARSPRTKVLIGYIWKRSDFAWLARWEENHLRTQPPWNGKGLACGMEFGVSPFVESRRDMVNRGSLFGTPTFRWVPAKSAVRVEYCAFITTSEVIPKHPVWDGGFGLG